VITQLATTAYVKGRRPIEFELAADRLARAFGLCAISAAIVAWSVDGNWWTVPGMLAVWCAGDSVLSSLVRSRLERMEELSGPPITFSHERPGTKRI
jgi:hypothetical protein